MFCIILSMLLLSFCLLPSALFAAAGDSPAKAVGLSLEALSADDLDAINRALGYRLGVLIIDATPNSPAGRAGLKKDDILFTIGGTGVDSLKAVDDALAGKTGKLEVVGVRPNGEQFDLLKVTLDITTAPAAVPFLPAAPGPNEAAIREKLKSLEAAHAAGILTDAEYAQKKAALEAQLPAAAPQLDPETQRKLKALDDARAAGILSDAEYAQKKQQLLGQQTAAAAPGGAPGPGDVSDAAWGWGFTPPAGWKYQKGSQGVTLGHDTIPGMILVMPHAIKDLATLRAQMQQGIVDAGVQFTLAGQLEPIGDNALAGVYDGIMQGARVKARSIGTISPYGGGAFVVALTLPEKFDPPILEAAAAIARGMRYVKSDISEMTRYFAGIWKSYTPGAEKTVTLALNGEFYDNTEASFTGSLRDYNGNTTVGWGSASQTQATGRWAVRGTREQGVITFTPANGQPMDVTYRVHIENGQPTNAYEFNGVLFGRQ